MEKLQFGEYMNPQDWISTKDAAIILGVSQRTLQNWVDAGRLESFKTLGGHRRVLREAVTRLASQRGDTSSSNMTQEEQLRVLVVEDDLVLQKLYKLKLENCNVKMSLELASNGYQALVLMGMYKPHVLITDLKMPGMDGFELVRQIQAMKDFSKTKIVVITGLSASEIISYGGIPDGVAIQSKPVSFEALETMLHQIAVRLKSL